MYYVYFLPRHVLLWIYRPFPLWVVQIFLATATFTKALLYISVAKVRFYFGFILEVIVLCFSSLIVFV